VIHDVIPSVAYMWLGSGYSVFLWGENSSNKFEIKKVGKKEHRWGSGATLEVVVGWSVWCDSWCDSISGVYAPRFGM
jgi:hypothetical protein